MEYASKDIRNILVAGHAGCGKTTLTEALLYLSGATERMGRVEDGTTASDFDPEEARRKASLNSSVIPVESNGTKFNLIDVPGLFDFETGAAEGITAAESVLICVSGRSGVTVGAEKAYKLALKNNKARMVFVTKSDLENSDYFKILEQLKIKFGPSICPCVVPARLDDGTVAYINLFSQKAFKYESGKQVQIDLPDIGHRFEGLIQAMYEAIAETDETLMEKFFEGEPFTTEEIVTGMAAGVRTGQITPVFCGSAVNLQALDMLLYNMKELLPSAATAAVVGENAGSEPVEITVDDTAPTCAYVFKTVADPFVGRLSYLKLISGVLTPGMELTNARTGKKDRLGHLYVMMGKEATDVKSAKAGDIIVVPKLTDTRAGDTLSQSGTMSIDPLPLPVPQYPVAIEAANKKEEDKVGTFLARAVENDPTLRVARNEQTHQTIVTAMGEAQVETLLARMKEQAKVEARLVPVRIPYRETITKTAEAQGRHKKQTGGAGQFGDCWLRISPNPGEGYEFSDEIKGGAIPGGLIPAVDKGVQEAMAEGFLAGYPMVDIKCAVFDGSYHSVDSNEMAFKTAARIGFRAACEQAGAILLEPMATMDIVVTEEYAGTVMGDIATRRGRIVGTDSTDEGETVIMVRVPYAEVISYTKDLRAMTRGSGSYYIELEGYDPAPADVTKKLVEAYQASKA